MKKHFKFIPLFILSSLIIACVSIPKGESPVSATWIFGQHTFPETITKSGNVESFKLSYKDPLGLKQSNKLLKPKIKSPVAIYMHGCAGIKPEDDAYKDILLSQGFTVFMLDSFARPSRQTLCGMGDMTARIDTRLLEVHYALKKIRKLSWVDQKRLVLAGFSEGGNTADNWYSDAFAGIIILGSACTHSMGSPAAPKNVPVLAIVGESDDYRPGQSCVIKRTIKGSKSIVIPNADHWVAHYDITKNAIKSFLQQCCLNN